MGEIQADVRVQADPRRAEERTAVHHRDIDPADTSPVQRLYGPRRITADPQVEGQPVAAAAGQDAQHLVRPEKTPGHLADGPVAADGHDDVRPAFPRNHRTVPRFPGRQHLIGAVRQVQMTTNGGQDMLFVPAARNRIDDEGDPFHIRTASPAS